MMDKILVVDDDEAIINLLEQAFSRAGYDVKSAQSSENALELLQNEKIHVMFLDLNMPGMNGIELCRKIRKDMPMANIFAVTGYASLFELADCREAGFDDYFKKPVNIKILVDTAKNAFEKISRWKET
ncbi:MAG: response regulator [Desulfobacula sp.]|nr:response regulator [Desulfobacula sp.]MCK5162143.1 response regulator [Desulfobacula sp.]